MKYVLINKRTGAEQVISKAEAEQRIAMYYDENVATYDEMLSEPTYIRMMFSDIRVENE